MKKINSNLIQNINPNLNPNSDSNDKQNFKPKLNSIESPSGGNVNILFNGCEKRALIKHRNTMKMTYDKQKKNSKIFFSITEHLKLLDDNNNMKIIKFKQKNQLINKAKEALKLFEMINQ